MKVSHNPEAMLSALNGAQIMEIIETGKLRRIEHEKTVDVQITKLFQGIYGVGGFIFPSTYTGHTYSLT